MTGRSKKGLSNEQRGLKDHVVSPQSSLLVAIVRTEGEMKDEGRDGEVAAKIYWRQISYSELDCEPFPAA